MTLVHRHLDLPGGLDPEKLPLDALDDILDRGDFDDWRILAAAVRRQPHGRLADALLALCGAHEMYGVSRLWPAFIKKMREGPAPTAGRIGASLASLASVRQGLGRSQAAVGAALGISQSDVSKLERRHDLRVSSLQRYIAALGGELQLTAHFADGQFFALDIGREHRRGDR